MKLIGIFSVLLVLNTSVFAQGYVPFPTNNAVSANVDETIYYVDDMPAGFEFSDRHYYCVNGEDTLIGAYTFTKLFRCGTDYKGAVLDVDSVVYFVPDGQTVPYTLYDFRAEAGDTLNGIYTEFGIGEDPGAIFSVYVLAVDSVLYGDNYRKRIHFNKGAWIEGVGNTNGLFKETFENISGYNTYLECMSSNDTTYIYNGEPSFSLTGCPLNLSVDIAKEQVNLTVYPNPSSGLFYIDIAEIGTIQAIELSAANGKKINVPYIKNGANYTVNLSGFAAGIYILSVQTDVGTHNSFISKVD